MAEKLIIGSRSSKLAMTQSEWVRRKLLEFHTDLEVEIVEFKTTGDRKSDASLSEIGGKGAFTKELEDALLDDKCDLAVHSLKDLPTVLPDGLKIGCTPTREVTDDSLVYRGRIGTIDDDTDPLAYVKEGATVGTSSLRRKAQLLQQRPDLNVIEFRGNVDTRLRKLDEGQADAIVLAAAGLSRLGLIEFDLKPDRVNGTFDALALRAPEWLPAVGQGALGIEIRADDARVSRLLTPLHNAATWAATAAERAFLNTLGAGCMAPVGACAEVPDGSTIHFHGRVLSTDGKTVIEHKTVGEIGKPSELGQGAARWCLENGADKLV